jgi:hypothetical protein
MVQWSNVWQCIKVLAVKMKNLIFLSTFFLSISVGFGQYMGYSPIEDANVSKWLPKFELEYFGTYHFGDSEAESTLILFTTGVEIIAQIKSGTWNSDATDWIWLYKNLANVRVDKSGKFFSDEYIGEFSLYNENGKSIKCLKIYDSWSGAIEKKGEYELGYRIGSINHMYSGKYAIASIQQLDPHELMKMSSQELKIMRNEIFARYGYQFQEGGEMNQYFRKQNWYKAQHKNVNQFLTALEKRNIELIQTEENRP